jgi:hypothetical protein
VAVDEHYIVVIGTVGGDFVYNDPLGIGDGGPDLTISEHDLLAAMGQSFTPRVGFALTRARI